MIKKLLPLLLLILIGCSEPEMINGDFLKWGGDGFYHKNTGKIFTGNVYELKSEDNYLGYNIYERGFIKNGRQEGTFTSIYRDPTLREGNIGYLERDFKDGELQFERGYYHSRELYYQFEFKYGKKDGLFNRYSEVEKPYNKHTIKTVDKRD